MIRRPDLPNADLPATARPRVNLPTRSEAGRVFPGWGPELGR
jgi:hypothetical protein